MDDEEFEFFVVAGGDEFIHLLLVEAAGDFEQFLEDGDGIGEMLDIDVLLLCSHDLDVEADGFAVLAVVVEVQDADLVEGAADVNGTEGLVLVELKAVLVVEMDGEQLLVGEGVTHFVRRIKVGEDGVCAFDVDADAAGIAGQEAEGDGMAGGRNIGVVNGFIGLGLDGDFDLLVVVEHFIDDFGQALDGDAGILCFADVGAFAGEPEDNQLGAEDVGDVDGFFEAVLRVCAGLRVIGGESAVDGLGIKPETRGDKFRIKSCAVEFFTEFFGDGGDLRGSLAVDFGDCVVIMELDAVEAEFLEKRKFFIKREWFSDIWAERVCAFVNVPGAECKTECACHVNLLCVV